MMKVDNAELRRENARLQEMARDMWETTREWASDLKLKRNHASSDLSEDQQQQQDRHTPPAAPSVTGSGGGSAGARDMSDDLNGNSNVSVTSGGSVGSGGGGVWPPLDPHGLPPRSDGSVIDVDDTEVQVSSSNSAHATSPASAPLGLPPSSISSSPQLPPPVITSRFQQQQQQPLPDPPSTSPPIRSRSDDDLQPPHVQNQFRPISHPHTE
ncbi:hypothetical protein HK102_012273, partial [Quaeritorhiza haematococci]